MTEHNFDLIKLFTIILLISVGLPLFIYFIKPDRPDKFKRNNNIKIETKNKKEKNCYIGTLDPSCPNEFLILNPLVLD